jgi:hypothetical protein
MAKYPGAAGAAIRALTEELLGRLETSSSRKSPPTPSAPAEVPGAMEAIA